MLKKLNIFEHCLKVKTYSLANIYRCQLESHKVLKIEASIAATEYLDEIGCWPGLQEQQRWMQFMAILHITVLGQYDSSDQRLFNYVDDNALI
jgi:hypothetical protein